MLNPNFSNIFLNTSLEIVVPNIAFTLSKLTGNSLLLSTFESKVAILQLLTFACCSTILMNRLKTIS